MTTPPTHPLPASARDEHLRRALQGRFVAFEGVDGSGKTTQVARVVEALRTLGLDVERTREPSDGPIGRVLRDALVGRVALPDGARLVPETIAALFVADRADHRARTVLPGLARGATVITDRYVLSSLAYQGDECDPGWVAAANGIFPWPDLTVFLELSTSASLARAAARAEERQIYEESAQLARIAQRYREAFDAMPATKVKVDAAASVEEVTERVLDAIAATLR